jgi:hypothetical protein
MEALVTNGELSWSGRAAVSDSDLVESGPTESNVLYVHTSFGARPVPSFVLSFRRRRVLL